MRRLSARPIGWYLIVLSIVTATVLSCATLPPVQPAKDLKSIVGRWEGRGVNRKYGSFYLTLRIRGDGTWQMRTDVSFFKGSEFSGKVRVFEGEFEFDSENPQLSGTYTLHSGKEGERWLVFKSDDKETTAELRPSFRKE